MMEKILMHSSIHKNKQANTCRWTVAANILFNFTYCIFLYFTTNGVLITLTPLMKRELICLCALTVISIEKER